MNPVDEVTEPSKMDWKPTKDFLEQITIECEFHLAGAARRPQR
jgi:hypothetical protein